jgi:regulatory protein
MRSRSYSPRKFSSQAQLHTAAVSALMRRAYSVHDMKEYLTRRAEDQDHVGPVLARLRELRYLDDARYALEFVRQRAQSRRQGRFRIARDLRGHGVPDQHIESALQSVFAETSESDSARTRIRRKLAHLRGPLDERKAASLYRSLLRAGFSADIIRAEVSRARSELRSASQPASADSESGGDHLPDFDPEAE